MPHIAQQAEMFKCHIRCVCRAGIAIIGCEIDTSHGSCPPSMCASNGIGIDTKDNEEKMKYR